MPECSLLSRPWGNIVILDAVEANNAVLIIAQCEGTRAKGEMNAIFRAIKDSDSPEDFARICTDRGLLVPESDEEI